MFTDHLNTTAFAEVTTRSMVLLIDDQALVGEVIRRILVTDGNIDFHYCSDPEKALEMALSIKPTVILQDLVMPGVDGLDLVRLYKTHECKGVCLKKICNRSSFESADLYSLIRI